MLPLDARILKTVISLSYGKSSLAENKSANIKVCNCGRTTVVFHSSSSDHIKIFAGTKALEGKMLNMNHICVLSHFKVLNIIKHEHSC